MIPDNDPKKKQQSQDDPIDINEVLKGAAMYSGKQPIKQNISPVNQMYPDGHDTETQTQSHNPASGKFDAVSAALKNRSGKPAYKNYKPKPQQSKPVNPLEYDFGFDPNSLLQQKSETTQKQTAPQTQNAAASQFRANEIMAQPDIQKSELTAETRAANNQIVSDFESIVLEYGVGNDAFQRFSDYLIRTQKMTPADAENLANLTFAKVNSPDRVELTKPDITPDQYLLNKESKVKLGDSELTITPQSQFALADYLQQVDQKLAKLNFTGVNAAGAAKQEQVKNFQQQEFTPGVFDNGYMTTDKVREMVDLIPQMGDAANMDAITMAKIHAANRIDQLNVDQATKDNYKKIADAKLNEMDPLLATEWILRDRLIEIETALSIPKDEIFSNPELIKQRLDQAGLPNGQTIFDELLNISTGLRQIEKTREIQNAPKRGEESVGDFFQYFADNGEEALADALTLGLYGYGETKNVQSLIERGTGPDASDADKAALMAYIFKNETQQNTPLSWVYNTGGVVSEVVPFMLTFGAGRGIAKGLSWAATRYVTKQVGKITTKILPRVAGTLTEASIEGAFYTAVSPQFLKSYAQRQIKDVQFTTDADGNITADFSKVEDPITSAYKAGISTWLEFSTEGVGELFTGGRKLIMSEINRRIGRDIMSKSGDELVSFISKAKKDLRYDGFLGEYGEELVNGIAAPILTGEGDVSDFFKEENQYQLITSILLVDGAFKTVESVANGVSKIQNAENKRSFIKAGDALNSIFGEDQAKEIQSILLIDNLDERKKELIDNGYLTPEGNFDINAGNKIDSPEKAQALIDYMKAQAEYGASNSFETEQVSGELSKVVNKETGNVIIAEDAEGNNFFVTKRSMNSVLVVNMDTGQPQWRSASAIRILSETPADQFASQHVQQQEAEVETQLAQQEAVQQTPPAEQQPAPEQQQPVYVPQLRDKHTIEGKDYYVSQVGDGMVQLTPVENTDGLTPPLTVPVQQLSDMVAAQQQPVAETPVNTEAPQATTEGVVPTTEAAPVTTEGVQQEQQPVPEQQKPVIRQLHSVDGKTTFDFTIDQSNNAVSNTTVASQKEAEKIISKLAEAYEGKLNFAFENISDPNDPWAANEFRIIATPIQKQVEQPAAQQEQAPVPEQQAPEVEQQPIEQPSETLTPTAENLDTPAETLTPQQKTPAPETVQPEVVAPEAEVAPVVETPKNTSSPEEIAQQEAVTNTNPTDGQKEAGNYKKGRIEVQGLNIAIENPKGSERSGVDESGEPWSITMNNTYGYFERSKGKDGDQVDLFLGDNLDSPNVFVIDQLNADGTFDEHKVMLGFNTQEEAVDAYMSNYNEGWTGFGAVSEMDIEEFKQWLGDGKRTHLPLSWSPDIDHTTTESEWIDAVIKYSADPTTVFQAWQIETDNLPYNSLLPWQQAIVDGGYRTTPESFARWGDKSEVGKTFAILFYPNKKRGGTPIDTIAQELGMEGTPEECSMIADFMVQVSRNEYKNSDRRKALTEKFRMLTGYFPSQYESLANKSNLDRIKAFLKKHGADKSLTFAEQLESIKEKLSQYQYEALKQYIFASRNGQIETPLLQTSETHSDSGPEYTEETSQDTTDDTGTRSGSDEAEGGEDLGEWATPFSVADNNLSPQSRERLGQLDKELAAANVRLRNAQNERNKHEKELQDRVNLFGVDNEGPANQISMFDNIESNTTSENFQAAMEPYNRRVSEAKAYLENLEKVRAEIIRTDGNNLTLFSSTELDMVIAEAEADIAWHKLCESVARNIAKELGGIPIRVISNIALLSGNAKNALNKAIAANPNFKADGYFDPETGEVVVIPTMLSDINKIKKVVVHEVVGHMGMRQMLGEKFDESMLRIYDNMTQDDIDMVVSKNPGYYGINEGDSPAVVRRKKLTIADEFLAYSFDALMNETAPTWLQNIWAEIKQMIREFFNTHNIPFSESELRVLAEKSKQNLIRNYSKANSLKGVPAFSMAGDIAIKNMDNAIEIEQKKVDAIQMDVLGMGPDKIKLMTGWEKGPDGKWFYEFSDRNFKMKGKSAKNIIADMSLDFVDPLQPEARVVVLSDIISAPEHFKYYPQLAKMKVRTEQYDASIKGGYERETNTILVNSNHNWTLDELRHTFLHEVQHAIQGIEGFESGASMQTRKDALSSIDEEISLAFAKLSDLGRWKNRKVPGREDEIVRINEKLRYLGSLKQRLTFQLTDNDAYAVKLGEVNARNVTFRDELRNKFTEDLIKQGIKPEEAVVMADKLVLARPFSETSIMPGMQFPVAMEDALYGIAETGKVAMDAIQNSIPETINIDGVERPTRNSNGQIIHSSEEGIRNFYKWFGESKVVDEQGRPLVVYHGTNIKDINEFYNGWFSEQKDVAVDFGQYIYPSYLKIENPIDDSDMEEIYKRVTGSEYDDMENSFALRDWIVSQANSYTVPDAIVGYDGVITYDDSNGIDAMAYVPFASNQIKSATENTGSFSPSNSDIRFHKADPIPNLSEAVINLEKQLSDKHKVGLDISYRPQTNSIYLSRIVVPKEMRGTGIGSGVMLDLIDFADNNGLRITLSPSTDFGATSKQRLVDFYKKHGFIQNKGRNADYSISESMYREPRVNASLRQSESIPETINIDGVERPTRASNGRVIFPTIKGIENFWRWFGDSKVVDDDGRPVVNYSGHSNISLYGDKFDPKKSTAGGFYATEDPQVASGYALSKFGSKEGYEHGSQYRLKGKNGKFNKKLWQIELTDEQKKKMDELAELTDEYGEHIYEIHGMREWAKEMQRYEPLARRLLYQPYNLQNIWEFNEYMGYNIAYDKQRTEANEPHFLLQQKNETERLMDALGIEWDSYEWDKPGIMPVFLSIKKPLDADYDFPQDVLDALKQAAKGEHTRSMDEVSYSTWTKDYPLKEFIADIERGSEGWTTQVPKKALPIFRRFGYDGIKERGQKGSDAPREERSINWIAFDPTQIKSATGNNGNFNPDKPEIMFRVSEPTASYASDNKQLDIFSLMNQPEQENSNTDKRSNNPTLRSLEPGETALVERKYRADKNFKFFAPEKIESIQDVAYIFKNLEDYSVENAFAVYVKNGKAVVQHIGMGTFTSTQMSVPAIVDGANRFDADEIYFVHNHPSGQLIASDADARVLSALRKVFGNKVKDGVIINLDSGKFSTFDVDTASSIYEHRQKPEKIKNVNVVAFTKQVFNKDYSFENSSIRSSVDVAKFISSHRLGKRNKLSVLIMKRNLDIVANIFLPYSTISVENLDKLASELSIYATRFGGTAVLPYGRIEDIPQSVLNKLKQKVQATDISFLDFMRIESDSRYSSNDGPGTLPGGVMFHAAERGPVYSSTVETALNKIQQDKGLPAQWKAMLMNSGAKPAELEWMGWDDFVKTTENKFDEASSNVKIVEKTYKDRTLHSVVVNGEHKQSFFDISDAEEYARKWDKNDKVISKSEIQKWIDSNRIEIKEVVKGRDEIIDYTDAPQEVVDVFDAYESGDLDWPEMLRKVNKLGYDVDYDMGFEVTAIYKKGTEPTKYSKYQLPGGDNYREILLTLSKNDDDKFQDYLREYRQYFPSSELTDGQIRSHYSPDASTMQDFKSDHWDEPNILAHVRFNERKDSEGNKVLFLEEVQSDWAQKGKKEGFDEYYKKEDVKPLSEETIISRGFDPSDNNLFWYFDVPGNTLQISKKKYPKQEDALNYVLNEKKIRPDSVPDMPYKKTDQWAGLVLRRMMRYAAENGFDKIAWTTGEQQAERYDLSKQVDKVAYSKTQSGTIEISIRDKKKSGRTGEWQFIGEYKKEKLSEIIGKELAEKISKDSETRDKKEYSGIDLKVGGEGMKAFYDQIIPSIANKIGKKFGAQVQPIAIETGERGESTVYAEPDKINYFKEQGYEIVEGAEKGFENSQLMRKPASTITQLSIPVTESMKESVMAGVPLFRASDSPRIPQNQKIVRGTGNKLRMLFGDRMQPVKLLQNEILRRGGKIDSFTNPYDQENKSRSRAMARIEKTREKFLEPIENNIVEIMKANRAVTFEDIEKYLIAKHAPERNEYYRVQNKDKNPDAVYAGGIILPKDHPIRVRYFEQEMANKVDQQMSPEEYLRLEKELNDKLDFDGVPMRDEIANEIAAEYESMFGKDKANKLSESIHNMNKEILDLYLEYGAINEKQHEELSTRWNNYVPLRGWREDGKDIFDWQQSRGGNMNMLKSAEGRISEADSPLAYMENMMMSAIVWGEDNKVKQSFLNMARNNMDYKDGLFDLKKVWYITTDAIDAETGKNKVIATTVKPPQELFDADMVSTTVTSDYKSHLPATLANQRIIEVVENGEKYEIITTDPDVANAINHNNDMWQDASRVSQRTIGKVTRFMSSLMTSKNPAFIIPNLTRDFAYAWISNASDKQGTSFVLNMRRASGAITRAIKGKAAPEKWDGVSRNKYYYDKLYADFIAGGGRTGFLRSMELDKIKAQIEKDIDILSRPLKPRSAAIRVGRFLNSTLDYMAGWSEDMSRFATYIASVRTGKSESEAIKDAKNVTVNFDRKGQLTSFLGAMYAFFNPAVQGGLNFMGLAKKNKKAITAASVSFFALGYIMGALNRMVGGDDDEFGNYYEALNPYLRKNYLIIPTFWDDDDKTFISIPLPPVFRSFYGMGERLHDVVNGNNSISGYVAGSLSDFANSFSPFEPSQLITENGGITIRPLVPTGLQPMFDVWITGKDFTGNNIRNAGFTKKIDELTPSSMQAKKNTGEVYQWISDRLFELGGGDPKVKSLLSIDKEGQVSKVPGIMDWNPSNIEYLMESYLGGRGQFFNQLAKTTDAVIEGAVKYARGEQDGVFAEVNANTVPILNRFVRQPWKSQYVDQYWKLFTRFEEIENYERAQFDAWYEENADKFPGLDPSKRSDKKSLMSHFEVDVDLKVNPFFMDDMKEASKTLKDVTDESERLRIMREISEKYFDQIIKQQKR